VTKRRRQNGFLRSEHGALSSTALWMIALLSLLALGLARSTLLELRLETYELAADEAQWLAAAGVQQALAVLREEAGRDSLNGFDAFTEAWANAPAHFKHVPCGSGYFEVRYSSPEQIAGAKHVYGVADENRKINLNLAPGEVLLRLPGMTPEKVAALLDWRDRDQEAAAGGAETPYYLALFPPYPCKDGKLDFMKELELIKGFTNADVQRLRPLATTYGEGGVNINTAAAVVLEALGLRRELAQSIVARRCGPDREPFTKDDHVFQSAARLVEELRREAGLKSEDQMVLQRLLAQSLLGVASSHFTITSVGVTRQGQAQKTVTAVVHRMNRNRVEVLSWRE
jgi:type II secretory pathway component PulK